MTATTRLYRVHCKSTGKQRLIEAATPRGAIAHAARNEFTADIPASHEVFAMAKAGIEIENATLAPISDETRSSLAQEPMEV